jgi:hypothetical protein
MERTLRDRMEQLKTQFDAVHEQAMASLAAGDREAVNHAIRAEAEIMRKHAALTVEYQAECAKVFGAQKRRSVRKRRR